ncbi:MAG: FAA hydrolase family protein [Sphingobacteriales bacterium]|nr:MAG: FAA hydrolase family protein [Sphingobacteriales bacterium]
MKIICIGRNYANHAKELNNDLPEVPVIFLKPETALLPPGTPLAIPSFTQALHYECELVMRIGIPGKHISEAAAQDHIDAITLGIDFTARDVQDALKQKRLPWELAKAFDGSAAVGRFLPATDFPDLTTIRFRLFKDALPVQEGHSADMLFSVPALIAFASQYFTLQPGDLIFTGTPEGVGPVVAGNTLRGVLEHQDVLQVSIG